MSSRILKVVTVIAVVAIVFSAFNTYLILDRVSIQDQLSAQEEKIDALQTSLEQLSIQNNQLDELQSTVDSQKERIDDLQTVLDELSVPGDQFTVQEEQIIELQTALNETRSDIKEVTSTLSDLVDQMSNLDQTTSTSLAALTSTVDSIQGLASEISDLEEIVNQLLSKTPEQVYADMYSSVVVIRTAVGQGSGFLFNNRNTIVTNYHVVTTETDIDIEFFDGTRTQATVIGSDAYSDVAVLSVSTSPAGAKVLSFSNQSVSIGQQVVAIGNPLGLTESLSVGYISQVNRTLDIEPITVPVLQLDLTIAPGSSGGPLLDLFGNVVGITNAGTDVGFNFAVPLNVLERVIPSLIENGSYSHAFIGVSTIALTPDVVTALNILNVDSYQNGLLVVDVVPDSPAEEAGLTPAMSEAEGYTAMDIILSVDGHPTFISEDLVAYLEVEVSPGQSIVLTLWRSGVTESVTVTTMARPPYQ
jgi:serine protease Do